jgi:flagellum-specific peptidoglycan hydrolase FlgJ
MLNVKTLTDTMSRMQLPQLQQYAALHKNDPYIVTLALSIANQKKQMQAGQAGQAGMQPQPKVVDQDIAQMLAPPPQQQGMAPPQQQPQLPEDQGIGQLPAQNMQGMAAGGIVAFDDGGSVPGYAGGTFTETDPKQAFAQKYRDAAVRAGKELGVDPGIIISQWGLETGWGKSIIPGTNNLGNIKDFSGKGTSAYDKTEKSSSKYRKYETPEAFADDYVSLIKRKYPESVGAGGDAKKFVTGLRPGEPGGYATDKDYASKFLRNTPVTNAQAATMPQAAAPSMADQIPGQSRQAPAAKPEDTSFFSPGWFEKKAEDFGMSKNTGRNIYNTIMAPTPAAPVTTLPSKGLGLAGLGEKIYNKVVPAAGMSEKQIAALKAETEAAKLAEAAKTAQLPQRITGPAQALEQGSQTIPVTQAGQATVQSAADLEKARLANQATDQLAATQSATRAAQEAAKLPSAAERLQQASYIRESDEAARLMSQARAATNAKTGAQTAAAAATVPAPAEGIATLMPNENVGEQVFDPTYGGTLPPEAKKEAVDALKEQTGSTTSELKQQAADSGMDWNSFLVRFGLGMMAGDSPYFSQNVGRAGLGALDAQMAEQKAKQAQSLNQSEIEYRKAMGTQALAKAKESEATTGAIERGSKEKNLELEVEKIVAQRMKDLPKLTQVQLQGDPARLAAVEANIRQEIHRQLGIKSTMAAGAPAPAGGFSVVGSRPS